MSERPAWSEHQGFESEWWGSCANSYGEETKQLVYARHMGIEPINTGGPGPVYDLKGKSILDIGGGPCSLLLKCVNGGLTVVVDPCEYPDWVYDRYEAHGVEVCVQPAEEFYDPAGFDEVWIYNVLQHVIDPQKVLDVAAEQSDCFRVFEWLNVPTSPGHPHTLTLEDFPSGLAMGYVNEDGAVGFACFGVIYTPDKSGVK